MAMLNAVLLASEIKKLHIKNQRQKRKRGKKCTYIARGCFIRSRRGLSCASCPRRCSRGAAEAAAERPQQALRMCKSLGHTARTCPRRQTTKVVDSYMEYNFSWLSNSLYLPSVAWWGGPLTVRITKCTASPNARFFTPPKI